MATTDSTTAAALALAKKHAYEQGLQGGARVTPPDPGHTVQSARGVVHLPGAAPRPDPGLDVPKPVSDVMTTVGNALEVPLTGIGANEMDYLRARKAGATPAQALARVFAQTYSPDKYPNSSIQHAMRLINRGQTGIAADRYSTTSILANKQRAALGDVGAQAFQHHPFVFSLATIPEEFANPANIATGELTGMAADVLKGLRIPTINRMKAMRDAARRAPAERAAAPQVEELRTAENQQNRYDVLGEDEPGSLKGFIKDPQARARATLHFNAQQAASAKILAARHEAEMGAARVAAGPKLSAAPAANRAMLPPGQQFAHALQPSPEITMPGQARLALPPPPEEGALPHAGPTTAGPAGPPSDIWVAGSKAERPFTLDTTHVPPAVTPTGPTAEWKPPAGVQSALVSGTVYRGMPKEFADSALASKEFRPAPSSPAGPGTFFSPEIKVTKDYGDTTLATDVHAHVAVVKSSDLLNWMKEYSPTWNKMTTASGQDYWKLAKSTGEPGTTDPFFSNRYWTDRGYDGIMMIDPDTNERSLLMFDKAAKAPTPKPLQTETYHDFIARRGGKAMTPEQWQAANADWHATWPEGSKPPVLDKARLVGELRAARPAEPEAAAAGPKVTAQVERPGPSTIGAGEPRERLAPGKGPGIKSAPRGLPMQYDPDQPIMPSGKKPPQGPFRFTLPVEDVADEVERDIREIADPKDVYREAQDIVDDLWTGMTKQQQQQYIDIHERTLPMPENDDLKGRNARRIATQRRTSEDLLKYEVATPGQLRTADTFITRLGSMNDPESTALEIEAISGAPHEFFTHNVRQGTLATHRTNPTYFEARHSGRPKNPDWEPAMSDEFYWRSRLEGIKLNKKFARWRELGVVTYPGEPKPFGWTSVADTINNEETPNLQHFGSKILTEGAFPPEIAKAIGDVLIRETSLKPQELLPTPYNWLSKLGSYGNWLAERYQTLSPVYHPPVNVYPSQWASLIANARNPLQALKGLGIYHKALLTGEGIAPGKAAGASSHFVSNVPAYRMVRPWPDLQTLAPMPELPASFGKGPAALRRLGVHWWQSSTPGRILNGERWQRISDLITRATENVTARPLYQFAEPRMAGAHYQARVAQGAKPARAALDTRQTIGEPENIPARARSAAQMFMFPSWRLAMARLWMWLLGRSPALYQGPQRAARAYNISRGAYDRGTGEAPPITSSQHAFPDIFWNRDKDQNPWYLSLPHPGNTLLTAINAIGNPAIANPSMDTGSRLASLLTTLMNPWLSQGTRSGLTWAKPAGLPNTGAGAYRLYDKDAPVKFPGQRLLETFGASAQRYAPLPTNPSGLAEMAGWSLRQQMGENARKHWQHSEMRDRHEIHKLRAEAVKALGNSDPATAAEKTAHADFLYNRMLQKLQAEGRVPEP